MTMRTLDENEIISGELTKFAKYLAAYSECSDKVQAIVLEMCEIVVNPESTEEERSLALDVFRDALFPGSGVDTIESHAALMSLPEARAERAAVAQQEQAFADRVKAEMKKAGMTQEKLAEKTGVGQPAIANILARKSRPQMRTVVKFANALGVAPERLWQ